LYLTPCPLSLSGEGVELRVLLEMDDGSVELERIDFTPHGLDWVLRMGIANVGPIDSVEYRVTVAVQVGTPLKPTDGAPLVAFVRSLAVQTPEEV
jgi:hypothetical protein